MFLMKAKELKLFNISAEMRLVLLLIYPFAGALPVPASFTSPTSAGIRSKITTYRLGANRLIKPAYDGGKDWSYEHNGLNAEIMEPKAVPPFPRVCVR